MARGEVSDEYESTPHSGGYFHAAATYLGEWRSPEFERSNLWRELQRGRRGARVFGGDSTDEHDLQRGEPAHHNDFRVFGQRLIHVRSKHRPHDAVQIQRKQPIGCGKSHVESQWNIEQPEYHRPIQRGEHAELRLHA